MKYTLIYVVQLLNNTLFKYLYMFFMEDENLAVARGRIDGAISQLKHELGSQVVDFPKIIYSMKGNKYIIEFLVDQRRTDIFGL